MAANQDQRVVWGCERPEMLISEVVAWHDRRTEDRNDEQPEPGQQAATTTDMTNPDGDFDQRLRPRGALFVELYNPWATPAGGTSIGRGPAELYNNTGLVLTRRAPVAMGATVGAPVWRMLVISGTPAEQNIDLNDPDPNVPTPAFENNNIERGIYIVNPVDSLPGNEHGRVRYYSTNIPGNNTAVAPLPPGRYAVLGPSYYQNGADHITTVGRRTDANEMTGLNLATTRRVVLRPNPDPNDLMAKTVDVFQNATGVPSIVNNIQQPVAVVIDAPGGTNMSVTEPMANSGYGAIDGAATWVPTGAAGDGEYQDGMMTTVPIDEPLDYSRRNLAPADPGYLSPTDLGAVMARDGTTPRYRTIHLQRLANPRIPFDSSRNPYITIDSSYVDLTAFNGLLGTPADEPESVPPGAGGRLFASNQRGEYFGAAPAVARNLWRRQAPRTPADITSGGPVSGGWPAGPQGQEAVVEHFFPYDLRHSFGFLNQGFGPAYNIGTAPPPPAGYTLPYDPDPARYYRGAPSVAGGPPFPWLAWNNRPFYSDLELMRVPYSRQSRLLVDYSLPPPPPALPTVPYNPALPPAFGHLLNFFQTAPAAGIDQATHLYRLFEHTHVPSKYISSDRVLNAEWFTPFDSTGAANPSHTDNSRGTEQFHPPYNKVSNYRDPGRVNINTIYDQVVWQAMFQHGAGPEGFQGPTFSQWVDSRRGHGLPAGGIIPLDNSVPTFFANPLRAFGAGELTPLPIMERAEVDCTLLRSRDIAASPTPTTLPLFENTSNNVANDTQRNPSFRGQTLERLSNLVTSRSNVYAVWITVGYFEVDPGTFQLGRELGSDTGEVKRHRGFYIIDRSIPVAFEPGENHNVDRAIRLRRFIE